MATIREVPGGAKRQRYDDGIFVREGYVTADGIEYVFSEDGTPIRLLYQNNEATTTNKPAYNVPAIVNGTLLAFFGMVLMFFFITALFNSDTNTYDYNSSMANLNQFAAIIIFFIGLSFFLLGNGILMFYYNAK